MDTSKIEKRPLPEHHRGFNLSKARKIQETLAKRVEIRPLPLTEVKLVGGVDVSYMEDRAKAAAVVLDFQTMEQREAKISWTRVAFPYIPTFLAFREAPPIVQAVQKLENRPHLLLVDGHGVAHPLGCGLASHVGVLLKIPTVGVAKRLLCGEVGEFEGRRAPIFLGGKIVGMALAPKPGKKLLYVSVGNLITLDEAVDAVFRCIREHVQPEPLKIAHQLSRV
ncbi:endonuclease V [Candidatus Hecatella orcuttiae]|uniref:endonuclease V n=1 Tax=Candidatus Hecatella orcuttiae TaxID=1935119 RepID=UPI0028683140|nr:endonuclease V [Candidatus Hecatella orcuttiae]